MITKNIKISRLLDSFPGALNILIDASPHFKKLQNKFLRKSLAGRVTIEQAAKIAGIDPDELLFRINNPAGKFNSPAESIGTNLKLKTDGDEMTAEKPGILKDTEDEKIKTLDVRPYIAGGQDPLKIILGKVRELEADHVLLLINSFEPVPLYTVLKKKGYEHWTETKDSIYNIYFYRAPGSKSTEEAKPEGKTAEVNYNIKGEEKIIELDVTQLEPPEPMIRIFETLPRVDENTILLVHHHREPVMLYEKLEERGYRAVTHKINDNSYEVLILKKDGNGN